MSDNKAAAAPTSVSSFIVTLVEAKGFSAAAVAMAGAYAGLNLDLTNALQFGAVAALGVSVGDTLLTLGGIGSKIESYMTSEPWTTYLDPNDFLGGAVGTAALSYVIGFQGRQLAMAAGVGAVAGGVAPKLSAYIVSKASSNTTPVSGQ